ncbi:hypothetical protein [Prauserella flavalba]|uniref:hypothetical protein n=1 Tax=Prauserella flavalba TaxID=1477506 RepID=UPI0036E9F30A
MPASRGIWRAFAVAAADDPAVAAVRARPVHARRREITGPIASHDAYDHLTTVCGWPHEEYVGWASATVLSQLGQPG